MIFVEFHLHSASSYIGGSKIWPADLFSNPASPVWAAYFFEITAVFHSSDPLVAGCVKKVTGPPAIAKTKDAQRIERVLKRPVLVAVEIAAMGHNDNG